MIKTLNILFLALVMGLVSLTAVLVYVAQSLEYDSSDGIADLFNILVPATALAGVVGSHFLFRYAMASVKGGMDLEEKFSIYRQGAVLRFAVLEGPGLFASVCYFLTGQSLYLVVTAAMLALMVYYRPSKGRIIDELNLNEAESRKLED